MTACLAASVASIHRYSTRGTSWPRQRSVLSSSCHATETLWMKSRPLRMPGPAFRANVSTKGLLISSMGSVLLAGIGGLKARLQLPQGQLICWSVFARLTSFHEVFFWDTLQVLSVIKCFLTFNNYRCYTTTQQELHNRRYDATQPHNRCYTTGDTIFATQQKIRCYTTTQQVLQNSRYDIYTCNISHHSM